MQKYIHQLEVDWPVHLLVHSLLLCFKGQNVILREPGKRVSHLTSRRRNCDPPSAIMARSYRSRRHTCSVYQKVRVKELVVSLTG